MHELPASADSDQGRKPHSPHARKGFQTVIVRTPPETLVKLNELRAKTELPRTVICHIIIADVIRLIERYRKHPKPYGELCVKRFDVPVPKAHFGYYRDVARVHGFRGKLRLFAWLLDIGTTVWDQDRLAERIRQRPDIQRIVKWLRK